MDKKKLAKAMAERKPAQMDDGDGMDQENYKEQIEEDFVENKDPEAESARGHNAAVRAINGALPEINSALHNANEMNKTVENGMIKNKAKELAAKARAKRQAEQGK